MPIPPTISVPRNGHKENKENSEKNEKYTVTLNKLIYLTVLGKSHHLPADITADAVDLASKFLCLIGIRATTYGSRNAVEGRGASGFELRIRLKHG